MNKYDKDDLFVREPNVFQAIVSKNHISAFKPSYIYTGVGSRSTPKNVLSVMEDIAVNFAKNDALLRSGGADGADKAFEKGSNKGTGQKEIYLPWKNFNYNNSPLYPPSKEAMEMAASIHPAWKKCTDPAKLLHARNCHQVLGQNLNNPSNCLICWTEGGEVIGGTATAIKLAVKHNIPIYNLGLLSKEQLSYEYFMENVINK